MKGSLCGAGAHLWTKPTFCPPSLAFGGGGLPRLTRGEGVGTGVRSSLPIFPVSLMEELLHSPRHPLQSGLPPRASHLLGRGWHGGSELSGLEAYKQMKAQG